MPPETSGDEFPLGKFKVATMPLGMCYLASVLEFRGFRAQILDMSMAKQSVMMRRLQSKLADEKPEVVGITSMSNNFSVAVKIAQAVKLWRPQSTVVMGGVHATFLHKELLSTIPEVDVVVRYEGEITMLELVRALEENNPLQNVKGISFKKAGEVISNPFRERIKNLDQLPYPDYRSLEPSVEDYLGDSKKRNFPVLTTRGCPFGCIYCSTMAFNGRTYRARSVASVVGELQYLMDEYRMNDVSFVDDNFTMQKDRVFSLCSEIKKLGITWGCSARVDQISEELLTAMRDAGCTDVFFGIESASQRVLDTIRKGFTIEQAKTTVKTAEKLGIKTHCSFIIGLPGESKRTLQNMIKFIEETKPSGRVLPNELDILPGTELFERIREFFTDKPAISAADSTSAQIEMLTRFYSYRFGIKELFKVKPPNIVFD